MAINKIKIGTTEHELETTIANVEGLQSALDGKAPSSHNHSASNITSGTLSSDRLPTVPASNGGTGQTSLVNSANSLINALGTGDTVPTDTTCIITQGGSGYTDKFYRRPASLVWEYIKSKISSVLGLTSTSYGGNAATATKINKYVDLSSSGAASSGNVGKYRKFGTITLPGAWDECSGYLLFTTREVQSGCTGILNLSMRTSSTVESETASLRWLALSDERYANSVCLVKTANGVFDLYVKSVLTYEMNEIIAVFGSSEDRIVLSGGGEWVDITPTYTSSIASVSSSCIGNASTATSATKATQDASGNVITSTYETKSAATSKLAEAKSYADSAAATVKNDLLNGAGGAYDTLKELGDLIDDNTDAIDALETVAANKADKSHSHAIADVSGLQTALDGKAASSHGTHVSYSTTAPVMDGTASVGSASTVARSDHKHPTDTSRAAASDLTSHTGNKTSHITSTERDNWNVAKTHADSTHAPSDAEKNQNAFSNVTVGSTTIAADSTTDTLTLVAGSNVTLTPDATNDKITIAATDTVYTHPASHAASMITGLATVATSGKYSDLSGTPTIPTVNNATLTIQKNGTNVATFTANSSTNATANITVPTKTSDLTNDSGFTGNTGTITGVSANGTSVATSGVANIPAASTSAYGVTKLSSSTSSTSTSLAATPSAVKQAYDLAAGKADATHYHNSTEIITASSSDGVAYTATVPSITALTAGVSFIMVPGVVSASTAPTLNVNGLGAKTIRRRLSSLATSVQAGYTATWLAANSPFRVVYDGTQWIVEGQNKPVAADLYGTLAVGKGGTGATTAEEARTNLGAAPMYTYGTDDLTAGTTALTTGTLHFVYE